MKAKRKREGRRSMPRCAAVLEPGNNRRAKLRSPSARGTRKHGTSTLADDRGNIREKHYTVPDHGGTRNRKRSSSSSDNACSERPSQTTQTRSGRPAYLLIVLMSLARHACSKGTLSQSDHCCSDAPRRTCRQGDIAPPDACARSNDQRTNNPRPSEKGNARAQLLRQKPHATQQYQYRSSSRMRNTLRARTHTSSSSMVANPRRLKGPKAG